MNKLFYLLISLLILSSCATTIPLSANYFKSPQKVGLIIETEKISASRFGSQALLEFALTLGKKFKGALDTVEPKIIPTEDLVSLYTGIYSKKGKDLVRLYDTIHTKTAKKFEKPASTNKKYSKIDIRYLKHKYNVDEVLLVEISYGIMVKYYSVIELAKYGYANIHSSIIDLKDNSLMYSGDSDSLIKLEGNWNMPPNYKFLENAIAAAIKSSIELENSKIK